MDLKPVRGTRDFPPEDMRLRNWLFGHFREVARRFAFEEYDAPILESEALYTRKAGEEITGQLYNFRDKGDRAVSLRPEMTPSLARMMLKHGKALPMPVRWFSIPQCWRYERMQRGRLREHYQWNMDIFGIPGVTAEAELLAAITTFFERLGLSSADVGIKVSNRKVLQSILTRLGVAPTHFAAVCVLVDKLEKLPREAIESNLQELGMDDAAIDQLIAIGTMKTIEELEDYLGADDEAVAELKALFKLARGYGYADWLIFDPSVVRGLAYYTGTVFEAFDRAGELRAICGGGRYDGLLSTYGGQNIPACGFGFGDVTIMELLKSKGRMPVLQQGIDDMVFAYGEGERAAASKIAQQLRHQGRSVELILEDKKVKWAFKRADRVGARRMIMVAPSELVNGEVRVKDLTTGEERNCPLDDL
ncbi:MAG: histidine--tRNA ligase [Myxococcota bacterium]|nr:histidine--tRNA ligase [Myxococcota bacterium]